jgi:hypothetical protein
MTALSYCIDGTHTSPYVLYLVSQTYILGCPISVILCIRECRKEVDSAGNTVVTIGRPSLKGETRRFLANFARPQSRER